MSLGRMLGQQNLGRRQNPLATLWRLHHNLGVAPVAAKGTRQDYLAYLSAIPA